MLTVVNDSDRCLSYHHTEEPVRVAIYRDSRYIHLPNSAFLGNIDPFIRGFDPSSPDSLEITANDKWIAVHPAVLPMIAALGLTVKPEKIKCQPFEATSRHYFVRIGNTAATSWTGSSSNAE